MICCCPGCKTGLASTRTDEDYDQFYKPALHKFPTSIEMRAKWINAIPRKNFWPNKHSRICSKHFEESCLVTRSSDKNVTRKKKGSSLQRLRLKPDAVPTIFSSRPFQYSKKLFDTTLMTDITNNKPESEESRMASLRLQVYRRNTISSLKEFLEKLDMSRLPEGVQKLEKKDSVVFYFITTQTIVPTILFSMIIQEDLTFSLFSENLRVNRRNVSHLCTSDKLEFVYEATNILAFMKCNYSSFKSKSCIEEAIPYIEAAHERSDDNEKSYLSFILEQLHLHLRKPNGRRFSPNILRTTASWYNSSSSLYEKILASGMMHLPSIHNLRRLAAPFTSNKIVH